MAHAVEEVVLRLRGFLELPVGLDELPRTQGNFRLQALPLDEDPLELDPMQPHAVGDQCEGREYIDRIGQSGFPRRRIPVESQAQRCLAPDRIGVGSAHFQDMVARLKVRKRDPVLRAQVDPAIGEAHHAVGQTVAARGGEVERAEVEREDVRAIVQVDAAETPIGRGAGSGHSHDLDAGQRDSRRLPALGQPRRIEDVEPTRAAEAQAAVAQTEIRAEIVFLALQSMLPVIRLHGAARGLVTHQPGIAAQPDAAGRIGQRTVDRIARQPLFARDGLKPDRLRGQRRAQDPCEPASVGGHPDTVARIDSQCVNRVRRQRAQIVWIVAEDLDDRAIRARKVEAASIRTDPQIAVAVFGDGADIGGAHRARGCRAERQLADESG